jgi:hypothetical protein
MNLVDQPAHDLLSNAPTRRVHERVDTHPSQSGAWRDSLAGRLADYRASPLELLGEAMNRRKGQAKALP